MIRKRIRANKSKERGCTKSWHNVLVGVPAFIIGNGPSLADVDLSILEDRYFTIGINRAFYLLDPTILMWQDAELWWNHRAHISRLKALKYCRDISDPRGKCYHFKLNHGYYAMPTNPAVLYGRGSTGPLSFQLAHCLGCDPIILLGMDCKYAEGKTDFYGKNPSHKPHTLRLCSRGLVWIKKNSMGRKIINCSDNNVFKERFTVKNVISKLDPPSSPQNRKSFIKRLTKKS
jgi:hypothetical protein